jgi:MoxR-like ATPase
MAKKETATIAIVNELNVPQVNTEELAAMLEVKLALGQPLMITGAMGIGKSSVLHQVAGRHNRKVRDVRLSQMTEVDLRGIPYSHNGMTHYAPPEELPHGEDNDDVLFLDEITSAHQSVQAPAYQLILDRRLGSYRLPKKASIVAAGNKISDNGVTFTMAGPLKNRFDHVELVLDFACWRSHAASEGWNPVVLAFLEEFKDKLMTHDPDAPEALAFCTPRSWGRVSKTMNESKLSDKYLDMAVASSIGSTISAVFRGYIDVAHRLPKALDIMADASRFTNQEFNLQEQYALSTSLNGALSYMVKNNDPAAEGARDQYFRFLTKTMNADMAVMTIRQGVKDYKIGMKNSEGFKQFSEKYGAIVKDVFSYSPKTEK